MRDDLDEKRREILAAMDYAVAEADRAAAEDLLEIYREDRLGLTLLHAFYSRLPEAREAWVREIRLVNRHRGIFLLLAETAAESYFYLVSSEGVEFQGSLRDRYLAAELLDFFGYESEEAFAQVCAGAGDLPVYEPLGLDADICPACHAVAGEVHELGCPVEICPWCGGHRRGGSASFRGHARGAGQDSLFPRTAARLSRRRRPAGHVRLTATASGSRRPGRFDRTRARLGAPLSIS
jgi:hypothetical protein